jgi:hypothetical protein
MSASHAIVVPWTYAGADVFPEESIATTENEYELPHARLVIVVVLAFPP